MADKKKTRQQLGKMSRQKGATFERKIAKILTERGIDSRRAVQFDGMLGHDLISELPLNFECKAVESLNIQKAMTQSRADSKKYGSIPTVVHKKNNHNILITLELQDFIDILQWAIGYVDEKNTSPIKEYRELFRDKKEAEELL